MSAQRYETVPAAGPAVAYVKPNAGSTLFRGALGSVMVQVGGIGVAFGSQVGLAHLLGVAAFGQYVYIVAWVNLLCIFGRVGLDLASLRFIAEYCTNRQGGLLRGFVRRSIQSGAFVSVSIAVMAMVTAWFFVGAVDPRC